MGGWRPGPGVRRGVPGRSLKCSGSWAAAGVEAGTSDSQSRARGSPPGFQLLADAWGGGGGCSWRDLGDLAAARREGQGRILTVCAAALTKARRVEVQGWGGREVDAGLHSDTADPTPSILHSGAISTPGCPPRLTFSSPLDPGLRWASLVVARSLYSASHTGTHSVRRTHGSRATDSPHSCKRKRTLTSRQCSEVFSFPSV